MTDHPEPLTDEDLSAALDRGAGADPSDDVAARIAADPAAQARQAALRTAADAVAGPVDPLDPATVDDLVSTALARGTAGSEADAASIGDDEDPAQQVVRPLRRRRAGPPPFAVAATVLVLMAVGLALVYTGRSHHGSATTTAASASPKTSILTSGSIPTPSTTTAAPGAARTANGALAGADSTASGAASTTTVSPQLSTTPSTSPIPQSKQAAPTGPVLDLGEFSSIAKLRSALRSGFPQGEPLRKSVAVTLDEVVRCAGVLDNSPLPVRQRITQAAASVAGNPVIVYRYRATPPSGKGTADLITVVGPTACDPATGGTFFQN